MESKPYNSSPPRIRFLTPSLLYFFNVIAVMSGKKEKDKILSGSAPVFAKATPRQARLRRDERSAQNYNNAISEINCRGLPRFARNDEHRIRRILMYAHYPPPHKATPRQAPGPSSHFAPSQ